MATLFVNDTTTQKQANKNYSPQEIIIFSYVELLMILSSARERVRLGTI